MAATPLKSSGPDRHRPIALKTYTPDEPLLLESGASLASPSIGYQSWGELNVSGDNVIWVCHALTGNTDVATWWAGLFGPGRALDPQRYFIVCANVLGSCYGSAGPLSHGGSAFPRISVRDMVRHQYGLAQHLGVRRISLMLGGSMGGFQALEWALCYPAMIERLGLIATSYRQPAQAVALATLQCQQIMLDPNFNGGDYSEAAPPNMGLSLARQIGHLSYRSSIELDARFGRQRDHAGRFQVNNYLAHQGQKLTERFDANCYLRLNEAMNDFDACAGRGEPRFALSRIQQPTLVVAIDSDWLYPPSEQVRLAALLPNSVYTCVSAPNGHDGFLLEAASFEPLLAALLSEKASQPQLRLA